MPIHHRQSAGEPALIRKTARHSTDYDREGCYENAPHLNQLLDIEKANGYN